jgi:hypothetical protein
MAGPYCGWNKSSRKNGEDASDYDFLEYSEPFNRIGMPEPEEPEKEEID